MEIENTSFGTITIDGKTYEHDVVVRPSGEIVKRKKKLSKKYHGTSHMLSKDEAKFVFKKGCAQLIVGSGQMGNVQLSPEADVSRPEQKCIGWPEQKYISDAGKKAPELGVFRASGLGRIMRQRIQAGAA